MVVRRCDCVVKLARSAMLQLTLRAGFLSSFSPLHEPKLGLRVRVAPALIRARVRSFIRLRRIIWRMPTFKKKVAKAVKGGNQRAANAAKLTGAKRAAAGVVTGIDGISINPQSVNPVRRSVNPGAPQAQFFGG